MINKISGLISRSLLAFSALLAFLLSFLVVADVVGRVVFNQPVKGTPEIVSMSIVIICFLQASYAIRSGGMLRVDMFLYALPVRVREIVAALGCVLGALFFTVIVYGSIDPLLHAWSSNEYEGEGALRVASWPARAAVLLGCTLAVLEYVLSGLMHVRAALGQNPPPVAEP
ncbi:MAG: TRAP transporter small permease subunit [Burkholderiales bacterium]